MASMNHFLHYHAKLKHGAILNAQDIVLYLEDEYYLDKNNCEHINKNEDNSDEENQ